MMGGVLFNPQIVAADFELAMHQGAKDVWPNIMIHGCYFHFNQALRRRFNEVGLKVQLSKNKEFNKAVIRNPIIQIN